MTHKIAPVQQHSSRTAPSESGKVAYYAYAEREEFSVIIPATYWIWDYVDESWFAINTALTDPEEWFANAHFEDDVPMDELLRPIRDIPKTGRIGYSDFNGQHVIVDL